VNFTNHKKKDLTNTIFGRWKVISFSHRKGKHLFWNCICSCGIEKKVNGCSLKQKNLKVVDV
jgi:hypothetical protein